jgi:plasmid replication initiation protein
MMILEIDNKLYDVNLIVKPNPLGGKIVKLKNEFVYARYFLEIQEQRLLFNAMSYFDTNPFLKDEIVHDALFNPQLKKWDFNNITSKICDEYYCNHESRTIMLSVKNLIKKVGSRNYKAFDTAVDNLQKRVMIIDSTNNEGKKIKLQIIPIECLTKIIDKNNILITFSQSFMPYLLAFCGYRSVDLEVLGKLTLKFSARYYHWFLHALEQKGKKQKASFELTVDSLRERLDIQPTEHKKNFYERVVKKAIDEINQTTPIRVEVLKIIKTDKNGKNLRGNPYARLKFVVYRTAAEYAFELIDRAVVAKEAYQLEDNVVKLEYETALQLAEKAAEDAQFCPIWDYKEPDKSLEAIFDDDLFW